MNHIIFNFENLNDTFSPLEQCVDISQIDNALNMGKIVEGLIFQKAISNLHLFFVIAIGFLLLSIVFKKKKWLFALSLLFFTGVNAMLISIKLVMNLENISTIIWNFVLFFIVFLPTFYLFLKLLMPIVSKQIKKFYEVKNDKQKKRN